MKKRTKSIKSTANKIAKSKYKTKKKAVGGAPDYQRLMSKNPVYCDEDN